MNFIYFIELLWIIYDTIFLKHLETAKSHSYWKGQIPHFRYEENKARNVGSTAGTNI